MKPCSVCREVKPLEEFYRDASKSDGRMRRCKACDDGRVRDRSVQKRQYLERQAAQAGRPAPRRYTREVPSNASKFRGSGAWKRARKQAVDYARARALPCAICYRPIAWSAPRWNPWSASVDHLVELKRLDLTTAEGRRMAVDQANLRVVHTSCNSVRENRSRQNGTARGLVMTTRLAPMPGPRAPSGSWL